MERMWSGDAITKYPKQWVVMVNIVDEPTTHKSIGDVYLVTESKKEAYDKAIAIGDTYGVKMVIEGFNDSPQIGGLHI